MTSNNSARARECTILHVCYMFDEMLKRNKFELTGAGQEVGKSCVVVTINGKRIMFDCGMHMGYMDHNKYPDFSRISKTRDFNKELSCIIITHLYDTLCHTPYHIFIRSVYISMFLCFVYHIILLYTLYYDFYIIRYALFYRCIVSQIVVVRVYPKQSLYVYAVEIRSAYTLPSPISIYGNILGMLLCVYFILLICFNEFQ